MVHVSLSYKFSSWCQTACSLGVLFVRFVGSIPCRGGILYMHSDPCSCLYAGCRISVLVSVYVVGEGLEELCDVVSTVQCSTVVENAMIR